MKTIKKHFLPNWKLILLSLLISSAPISLAEDIKLSGNEIIMQNNDWNWRVIDEAGKPLQGVMVFNLNLWFGSNSYKMASLNAAADVLQLPKNFTPISKAIENWIRENPEPFELAQPENMYAAALPMSLTFRKLTDKHGYHAESRLFSQDLTATYERLFFKPGYYPLVLEYGFSPPPIRSDKNIVVTIQLQQWPERMQSLSHRPWVKENMTLQIKNDEQRIKFNASDSVFNSYPSLKLAPALSIMRDKAMKENFSRDAAWLTIAATYAPHKSNNRIDSTGGQDDLVDGRVYSAINEATQIAPDIRILQGRKNIRDFILRSPNAVATVPTVVSLNPDIPLRIFNSKAIWTKPMLDDYFATIGSYEEDPFTAIALTSQLAGIGLLTQSATELRDEFFTHRTTLRKKLMTNYPTVSWHSSGLDRWDTVYDETFGQPYYIKNK